MNNFNQYRSSLRKRCQNEIMDLPSFPLLLACYLVLSDSNGSFRCLGSCLLQSPLFFLLFLLEGQILFIHLILLLLRCLQGLLLSSCDMASCHTRRVERDIHDTRETYMTRERHT